MYLAQFYDDATAVGMHPSIGIDSGYLLASQGAEPYNPVGETGRLLLLNARQRCLVFFAYVASGDF